MLQGGLECGYALERVFLDRRPLQALHSSQRRCCRCARYDHQPGPALRAGLAVIRVWLSALLAEYHLGKHRFQSSAFRALQCPAPRGSLVIAALILIKTSARLASEPASADILLQERTGTILR